MKQTQADKVQEITEQLEQGIKDLFESQKYADYKDRERMSIERV